MMTSDGTCSRCKQYVNPNDDVCTCGEPLHDPGPGSGPNYGPGGDGSAPAGGPAPASMHAEGHGVVFAPTATGNGGPVTQQYVARDVLGPGGIVVNQEVTALDHVPPHLLDVQIGEPLPVRTITHTALLIGGGIAAAVLGYWLTTGVGWALVGLIVMLTGMWTVFRGVGPQWVRNRVTTADPVMVGFVGTYQRDMDTGEVFRVAPIGRCPRCLRPSMLTVKAVDSATKLVCGSNPSDHVFTLDLTQFPELHTHSPRQITPPN